MSDESLHFKPRRGNINRMATEDAASLVLESGEVFLEYPSTGVGTGASKFKVGDGTTKYSALPYAVGYKSDIATKLETARTITLSGNVTGTASFDGSGDITIETTASSATSGSSDKLSTARNISLSGGVTGTATPFDGSADITIPVTSVDMSYSTGIIECGDEDA